MLHGPVKRRWTPQEILALEPDPDRRAMWAEDFRRAGEDLGDLGWLADARLLDPPPPEPPDRDTRLEFVQAVLRAAYVASNGPSGAR